MKKKRVHQKIVVGAVIFNKNRALILKRSKNEDVFPGYWELPSGKRELCESSIKALRREINEETGLKICRIIPFSVFEYQLENTDQITDTTQINSMAEVKGEPSVILSDEHDDYSWIAMKQINDYQISEPIKKVLIRGFNLYGKRRNK